MSRKRGIPPEGGGRRDPERHREQKELAAARGLRQRVRMAFPGWCWEGTLIKGIVEDSQERDRAPRLDIPGTRASKAEETLKLR